MGLARGSEQGTVPVPLRLLEEWTVRLLEWTETQKVVRREHAQVRLMAFYTFTTTRDMKSIRGRLIMVGEPHAQKGSDGKDIQKCIVKMTLQCS